MATKPTPEFASGLGTCRELGITRGALAVLEFNREVVPRQIGRTKWYCLDEVRAALRGPLKSDNGSRANER